MWSGKSSAFAAGVLNVMMCVRIYADTESARTLRRIQNQDIAANYTNLMSPNGIVVHPYEDENGVIRLKISYEFSNVKYVTVIDKKIVNNALYVTNSTAPNNIAYCSYYSESTPSQNESFVVRPDLSIEHPAEEIRAGCAYNISVYLKSSKSRPSLQSLLYTVPECIGSLCDCRKHFSVVEMNSLQELKTSDDEFKITWSLSNNTKPGNRSHEIIYATFYVWSSQHLMHLPVPLVHLNKHENYAVIKLYPFPQDTNKLQLDGIFRNSFGCESHSILEVTENIFATSHNSYGFYSVICIVVLVTTMLIFVAMKCYNSNRLSVSLKKSLPASYNHLFPQSPTNCSTIEHGTDISYHSSVSLEERVRAGGMFEVHRKKVEIYDSIGEGAYGYVYKGKLLSDSTQDCQMVAVKTLGADPSETEVQDFITEIETFKRIGMHPNIVQMIGCCTLDLPLLMIMEYVSCGDLRKYLVGLRKQWSKVGNHDLQSHQGDSPNHQSCNSYTSSGGNSCQAHASYKTVSTNLDYVQLPRLELVLSDTELYDFALQIAQGMNHLEKLSITHRDLAARNILITEKRTLKISDFGLSRSGTYILKSDRKLPLRWMALESIEKQKFDSRTDVWSFAVVLWEIGTLGAFPYEQTPDSLIHYNLIIGNRLPKPELCSDKLYELMMTCWLTNPEERPTFEQLVEKLKTSKLYVEFSRIDPNYVFPPSDVSACLHPSDYEDADAVSRQSFACLHSSYEFEYDESTFSPNLIFNVPGKSHETQPMIQITDNSGSKPVAFLQRSVYA